MIRRIQELLLSFEAKIYQLCRLNRLESTNKIVLGATVGGAILMLVILYPLMPRLFRVIGIPVILLVAFWMGRRAGPRLP